MTLILLAFTVLQQPLLRKSGLEAIPKPRGPAQRFGGLSARHEEGAGPLRPVTDEQRRPAARQASAHAGCGAFGWMPRRCARAGSHRIQPLAPSLHPTEIDSQRWLTGFRDSF